MQEQPGSVCRVKAGLVAAIIMICLSACSSGRDSLRDAPLDRKAGNEPCMDCHGELPPFHHPVECRGSARSAPATTAGNLVCPFCHAAYTGKNHGKGENAVAIGRDGLLVEEDVCIECHPVGNPTRREEFEGTASHFMGDPTRPESFGAQAHQGKTTLWTTTRLRSRYGGANGECIICLSCHVFRQGPGSTLAGPLPHHLLATAGERYDMGESDDDFLCTGCHGVFLRKYDIHPLRSASVGRFPPTPPATITEERHLNCLSCHRNHGAPAQGGSYILKKVDGENTDPRAIRPRIDFRSLCLSCHLPY